MNRNDIFQLIEKERNSQDALWPRTDRRVQMYSFSAPHVLLLEQKMATIRDAWYRGENTPADFVKVAALAVRALEEIADAKFWEAKGAK